MGACSPTVTGKVKEVAFPREETLQKGERVSHRSGVLFEAKKPVP